MSVVTCLAWVPRGVAKSHPGTAKLDPQHLKEYINTVIKKGNADGNKPSTTENEDSENKSENEDVKNMSENEDPENMSENEDPENMSENEDPENMPENEDPENVSDVSKYNLDTYDDDDEDQDINLGVEGILNECNLKDDLKDPYIINSDSEDEFDTYDYLSYVIKDTDNLLVVGLTRDENGAIEVHAYNEEDDDFYTRYDILLPHVPLCVEWIGYNPSDGSPGNFIAVGGMASDISVWNLDIEFSLYPAFVLQPENEMKKCTEASENLSQDSVDAVLDVSWNRILKNILASGSASNTVYIWDLLKQKLVHKLDCHKGKVQSLQWHPSEPQFLLSSSTDGVIYIHNCNAPEQVCRMWKVKGEVERVLWNRFNPFYFICSTDSGFVHIFDCRKKKVLNSFHAHEDAVTGLDMSFKVPDILITSSTDRHVKMWNISEKLELISSEKLKLGSIYAVKTCPDSAYIVACGGDDVSNNLSVINISEPNMICSS